MTFRVGMKVVCIKLGWPNSRDVPNRPVFNQVYTIRAIVDDGIGLLLCEIHNPPMDHVEGYCEPAWWSSRFRPIVERKTDISCLTALLVPGTKIRETV
jgi:hypothetical protein